MNMQDQPQTMSVIAPKLNELDAQGFYLYDYVDEGHPDNWTADLVGDGFYKAQYQNATFNKETGEWSNGQWVETYTPPAPVDNASTEETKILKMLSDIFSEVKANPALADTVISNIKQNIGIASQ